VGVIANWDIHVKYYDLTNGAFNDTENLFIPFSLLPALELPTWGNTNGWKYEEINNYQDRLNSELWWIQFWAELPTDEAVAEYDSYIQNFMIDAAAQGRFEGGDTPLYAIRNVNEWMEYNEVVSEDNRVLVGLSFMFLVVCLANILGLLLGKFLRRAPEVGATMDLSMLLAAPVISILACILAGMYPAWLVCKTMPAIYLKTQ
jgi:putative ABC transport system permease protein